MFYFPFWISASRETLNTLWFYYLIFHQTNFDWLYYLLLWVRLRQRLCDGLASIMPPLPPTAKKPTGRWIPLTFSYLRVCKLISKLSLQFYWLKCQLAHPCTITMRVKVVVKVKSYLTYWIGKTTFPSRSFKYQPVRHVGLGSGLPLRFSETTRMGNRLLQASYISLSTATNDYSYLVFHFTNSCWTKSCFDYIVSSILYLIKNKVV